MKPVCIKREIHYPCPFCGSYFGYKKHVIKHIRQNHPTPSGRLIKIKFAKKLT